MSVLVDPLTYTQQRQPTPSYPHGPTNTPTHTGPLSPPHSISSPHPSCTYSRVRPRPSSPGSLFYVRTYPLISQPRNTSRDTRSTPHRCNSLARPRVRRWDFSSVIAHATHMEGANATRSTPMTYCVFPFESQCTYVSCCTTYNYVGHPCIPHPLRI